MVDLGKKMDGPETVMTGSNGKYYPSMYFDGDHAKDLGIDKRDIGDEFEMRVKVRVTSISKGENHSSISLEMREADVVSKSKDAASVLFPNG